MDIYIKNPHLTNTINYQGQDILPGEYELIAELNLPKWKSDSQLLSDIGSGIAIVAKDSSGNGNIIDVNLAINYLKGNVLEVMTQKEKSDITLNMACGKIQADVTGLAVLDIKVPGTPGGTDGRYVQGGSAWFDVYHKDDKFKVFVVDNDNLLGYGAGTVIGSYTDDGPNAGFYAEPDGRVQVATLGFFGFIPSGMYLRMEGQCGDGVQDSLYMNIVWGKKT